MAIDRTGITSLNTGAGEITYSGNQGPKSPDQQLMAMADPMIVEMYEQYVFEMEEQGMRPMPFREFMQQIIAESKMAKGGRAGYQGGQLVRPPGMTDEEWERYMFGIKGPRPLSSQSPYLSVHAYGGMANPTYTQKRKQNLAYGGIAGVDGRKRYGIGSWFQGVKDKFVDDIIPNEIKDNPILSSVAAGALLNQFGLPDIIPGQMSTKGMGQNWLGGLLSKIPGVPEGINTVLGDDVPFLPGTNQAINKELERVTGTQQGDYDVYGNKIPESGGGGGGGIIDALKSGATTVLGQLNPFSDSNIFQTTKTGEKPNIIGPLTMGLSLGALDAATRKDESLPAQQGIDIADIRSRALTGSDSDLRFLPPASATTAYANGGRTGYYAGNMVDPARNVFTAWSEYKNQGGTKEFQEWYGDNYLPEIASMKPGTDTLFKDPLADWPYGFAEPGTLGSPDAISIGKMAQGGRIGAQEGGLMDLGGMEKDYRNEGGFVPIGGQERADDVPARLSKNEFVFTADAVRSAGGGDIDKGAEVMENVMKNLEQGGQVSEESQGLEGARNMFATAQKLEGVM